MAKTKDPQTSEIILGVASYYRRFIEGYSQRSATLRELIAKNKPFLWGADQDKAFEDLKSALTSPPVLQYPRLDS